MTTTIGYRARIRFANETAPLAQLVIDTQFDAIAAAEAENFQTCQMCGHTVVELFTRNDNSDMAEVEICETCADTQDVSYVED